MSGGKETGRQKMIGMMYLVLTALLALNVSNAVLEKFSIIDSTLIALIDESQVTNDNKLKGILGSTSTDPKVIDAKEKAQKVRELTKASVIYLDGLKKQLSSETDGKAIEPEELITNTNRAEELMLDHKNPKIGKDYEAQLNKYVSDLNAIVGLKQPFAKLTKKATDYEQFKNNEHHKNKDFLEFSFGGVPTMAAIATVSQMQTEILDYETIALDSLNAAAEGVQIKFDKVVPMVRPKATIFVAGSDYEADLFISAASSGEAPEMFYNNSPVKVEEDKATGIKMGKIKFLTRAGSYNKDGLAEASYNVKIKVKTKEFIEVVKYQIAQPVPKFESESASTLYLDCGNEMAVSIPGLTESSGIGLSASPDEGSIQKMGPGKFVLIPKRPQMNVRVTINGSPVATQKFSAKQVPTPIAKLKVGNADYDVKRGIPPGTSIVRLVPEITDETFTKQNQKDAGYRIVRMTLQIAGKTPLELSSGTIELAKYGLRAGDSFSVYNVQVVRSTWDPSDGDNKPVNAKLEIEARMARQ